MEPVLYVTVREGESLEDGVLYTNFDEVVRYFPPGSGTVYEICGTITPLAWEWDRAIHVNKGA